MEERKVQSKRLRPEGMWKSQGQRERRIGLIECHFTLIGMGVLILYSIYPFLFINGVP